MSSTMLLLGGALTSAVLLLVLAPFIFREMNRVRTLDHQLAMTRRQAITGAGAHAGDRSSGLGASLRTLLLPLMKAGSTLLPISAREREKLTRALSMAGFPRRDALSLFLSCKLACAIVVAGIGALCAPMIAGFATFLPQGIVVVFAAMAGLVVGGTLPEYVLRRLVARRKRRMSGALPDALDLLVMCLESGLTFERSLSTVAEELACIEISLSGEFRMIDAEIRLGSSRRAVLQAYVDRTEVEGLRDLAMALIQGDRYGTPLTQSMKNIADAERVQRSADIAAWAARLPVLMSMPMLLLVVPGTMLLIAGPAILSAMDALSSLGSLSSLGGQ